MAYEFQIYEDGVMKDQFETENYYLLAMEGDDIRSVQRLSLSPIEAMILYIALRKEADELGESIAEKYPGLLYMRDIKSAEEPIKAERVEMTPEVIEAIVRQAKNCTERQKPTTSTVRRAVAKMLLSLRRALSAQS